MACDGIAEFPPCLIALQKLFACVKWPCLLGIVHDDDAAWTQQPCRHLEIEESELEIMVAVNQDDVELDSTGRGVGEERHGIEGVKRRYRPQLLWPLCDDRRAGCGRTFRNRVAFQAW